MAWLFFALVLILCYEVFMRYVLFSPTVFVYETATEIGVTVAVIGLAYTHLHDGHVRVDVFWRLLSPRGRAIADIIGALLFFFPLIIVLTYISMYEARFAWSIAEVMPQTYWRPPAGPVRTVMALGFLMFLPQGVAKLVRNIYVLKGIE